MSERNIERFTTLNQKLTSLLSDPQPGMFTWCIAYCETLKELGELSQKNPSGQYKGDIEDVT